MKYCYRVTLQAYTDVLVWVDDEDEDLAIAAAEHIASGEDTSDNPQLLAPAWETKTDEIYREPGRDEEDDGTTYDR